MREAVKRQPGWSVAIVTYYGPLGYSTVTWWPHDDGHRVFSAFAEAGLLRPEVTRVVLFDHIPDGGDIPWDYPSREWQRV